LELLLHLDHLLCFRPHLWSPLTALNMEFLMRGGIFTFSSSWFTWSTTDGVSDVRG
jgi:hypothetical protein